MNVKTKDLIKKGSVGHIKTDFLEYYYTSERNQVWFHNI